MFAVIRTGGKQYYVSAGDKIKIEKLPAQEGEVISFNEVLLVGDEDKDKIGQPLVKNALVEAEVLKQAREKKVVIFKYKPKKRYQVKRGHRQHFTEIRIKEIKATE